MSCWGLDDLGQVSGVPGVAQAELTGGAFFNCALDEAGAVSCWGDDREQQVSGAPEGGGYMAVDAGYDGSCAIDGFGAVACWGADGDGQVSRAASGAPALSTPMAG